MDSTIANIEVRKLRVLIPARGSDHECYLACLQTFRVPPRWLFVRVETSDGIIGWGESTLEGHTEAVEGAVDALRRTFCGWDAGKIQDIWQHGYRSKFYRGGPVLMVRIWMID